MLYSSVTDLMRAGVERLKTRTSFAGVVDNTIIVLVRETGEEKFRVSLYSPARLGKWEELNRRFNRN